MAPFASLVMHEEPAEGKRWKHRVSGGGKLQAEMEAEETELDAWALIVRSLHDRI